RRKAPPRLSGGGSPQNGCRAPIRSTPSVSRVSPPSSRCCCSSGSPSRAGCRLPSASSWPTGPRQALCGGRAASPTASPVSPACPSRSLTCRSPSSCSAGPSRGCRSTDGTPTPSLTMPPSTIVALLFLASLALENRYVYLAAAVAAGFEVLLALQGGPDI